MKQTKILIFILFLILVTGCSSSAENKTLLHGEWEYKKEPQKYEGGWGDIYSYEFLKDGTVKYFECLHLTLSDDGCINGSSVWMGKYSLKNNIVSMKSFEIDESDSYKPSSKLSGPKETLIVDFENMYLCDRQAGLDCNQKYEKVVD